MSIFRPIFKPEDRSEGGPPGDLVRAGGGGSEEEVPGGGSSFFRPRRWKMEWDFLHSSSREGGRWIGTSPIFEETPPRTFEEVARPPPVFGLIFDLFFGAEDSRTCLA